LQNLSIQILNKLGPGLVFSWARIQALTYFYFGNEIKEVPTEDFSSTASGFKSFIHSFPALAQWPRRKTEKVSLQIFGTEISG
jgi:hypothetical protein